MVVGDTEKLFPVPAAVPPQETVYHASAAPDPPVTDNMDEPPIQIVVLVADAEAGATGAAVTDIVFDTLPLLIALVQPLEVIFVTVIVALPAVVNPVAVNVPVPAEATVIAAVNPVADGLLLE